MAHQNDVFSKEEINTLAQITKTIDLRTSRVNDLKALETTKKELILRADAATKKAEAIEAELAKLSISLLDLREQLTDQLTDTHEVSTPETVVKSEEQVGRVA